VGIGDRVTVGAGNRPVELTVTGTVVVPEIGGTGNGLGEGAALTFEGLEAVAPGTQPNLALLRFAPGARDEAVAAFAALSRDTQPLVEAYLPASLYQFVRIRSLPAVVGALVVLLALATLVQNLVGVGWARRRELAVLKALGFTRGQVTRSALWQATCFAAVALVVGLPLGVAGGRLAWTAIGRGLGLPDGPAVPLTLLTALVPLGLLVANLVASAPGWLAARRTPSAVLRMK
jgi:predicted lysophospholipase L1 biosynthesis ABC-type transport system permease subunit